MNKFIRMLSLFIVGVAFLGLLIKHGSLRIPVWVGFFARVHDAACQGTGRAKLEAKELVATRQVEVLRILKKKQLPGKFQTNSQHWLVSDYLECDVRTTAVSYDAWRCHTTPLSSRHLQVSYDTAVVRHLGAVVRHRRRTTPPGVVRRTTYSCDAPYYEKSWILWVIHDNSPPQYSKSW